MGADPHPPSRPGHQDIQSVRIFLASPSADTLDARQRVVAVVQEIGADPLYAAHVRLDLRRWDDPARPVLCDRSGNPQLDVIEQAADPADCHLVIGLLANTMGGTLPADRFAPPAGRSEPWHCTEWEIEQGLAAGRTVWVFHDQRPPASKKADALLAAAAVSRYIDRVNPPDGPMREGWNPFDDEDDLATKLRHGLRTWLSREFINKPAPPAAPTPEPAPTERDTEPPEPLTPLQQSTLARLLADSDFRFDDDDSDDHEAARLRRERPAGLRGHLLQRWAEWCTGEGGRLDRRFVNLTLLVDQGREFQGERYARRGQFDRLAELLQQHADVHAWVLVGDPGSGKSTVLQHHELSCARRALQALAAAETAPGTPLGTPPGALNGDPPADPPEICVWHRLSEYGVESPPPAEWLAQRWPAALPPPAVLSQRVRLRHLLDGLNEIKAPDRAAQLEAIERWTAWAAEHAHQPGALAPIFSVRTLDQSPMSLGTQFEVHQIVLEPWQPAQIERFCAVTLGEGNALWPAIQADAALLDLSKLPFNLAAQCRLFRTLGRTVSDRAELMGGLFWEMLRRRLGDRALQTPGCEPGLLGPESRQHITSGRWTQTLCALPDQPEHGCLVPWLDQTAQRLQRQGRQVSEPRQTLLGHLRPDDPGWATPAQWLAAVRSLKLLGDGEGDKFSLTPPLRFVHQLWQEFFAARGIRHLPQTQPDALPDLRPPTLPDLDETIAKLGVQEPLPGPDPSHWEEPVKLAVQLLPDPLPWLRVLQPQNLALAGRAAVACRRQLEQVHGPAVLNELRQALLARSRDPKVDVRLRIEAGLVLGELGDPRYEERQGPHGRYLWPKQWVKIAGGVYRIGDDNAPYDFEKPETEVTLAPFEMAFAPVTNAEYRCFIEAGGYEDERWWIGETAQRWRREGIRNEQSIQDWTTWLAALREDFEAGVQRYFPGATPSNIETNLKVYAAWSEEEALRNLEHSFGGKVYREPGYWNDARFNAASQPVVGLTAGRLHEAPPRNHGREASRLNEAAGRRAAAGSRGSNPGDGVCDGR